MTMPSQSTVDRLARDDDPITLADAAQHFGFTVSTLRAEAGRGRLTMFKIGKRLYTSPNAIREMIEQCRVEPKGRDFTATRRGGITLSEMADASYDSATEAMLKLRKPSRNTYRQNIDRLNRAKVRL